MEKIYFEKTKITPFINFDIDNREFLIEGVSMPENPLAFYNPILTWFDEYAKNPLQDAEFKIQLDYFNTSTSKIILDILAKIKEIGNGNKIVWLYHEEDEEMKEAGDDYREIIGEVVETQEYK